MKVTDERRQQFAALLDEAHALFAACKDDPKLTTHSADLCLKAFDRLLDSWEAEDNN